MCDFTGRENKFFSSGHLAPEYFIVVADSKKLAVMVLFCHFNEIYPLGLRVFIVNDTSMYYKHPKRILSRKIVPKQLALFHSNGSQTAAKMLQYSYPLL